MVYKVVVEQPAQADAEEYAGYVSTVNPQPEAADRWLTELERAILSLEEMPRKYRLIEEQARFGIELRQFTHHSHRVIFHVDDATGTVHILRVYHGRRDELQIGDIKRESAP